MPLYEMTCENGHSFEKLCAVYNMTVICPECGKPGIKRMSTVNHTFGWRLTESSHIKGHKDELERDI
jgi:hypothetical protein